MARARRWGRRVVRRASTTSWLPVRVDLIANRLGQQLHNRLRDGLNPLGQPASSGLSACRQSQRAHLRRPTRSDLSATRRNVEVTAYYTLVDNSGNVVMSDNSQTITGYDEFDDPLNDISANESARGRSIDPAGRDDQDARVAAYFAQNADAAGCRAMSAGSHMPLDRAKLDKFLKAPDESIGALLFYGPDEGLAREYARAAQRAVLGAEDDPFRLAELTADQIKDDGASPDGRAQRHLHAGRQAGWCASPRLAMPSPTRSRPRSTPRPPRAPAC